MNSVDNFLIFIFLFALFIGNDCVDPDEQLCLDLTVDAAVLVDMDQPTVFKGDHYWKLDVELGLSLQFGEKITNRWPGLPTPLNAAFSIDDETHRNSTVFITQNDKWYHYKGRNLLKNGSTSQWPFFPKEPIDAVLTFMKHFKEPKRYEILMMYGDMYSAYTFENINSPTYHYSKKSFVNGTSFLFLTARKEEAKMTIDQIIKVKAAISDRYWVVFFGYKNWCKAVTFSTYYKCEPQVSTEYFRCPRETRPVTIPPPTEKPKPTKKPQTVTKSSLPAITGISTDDSNFTQVSGLANDNNGTRNKASTKHPEESKLSKEKTQNSSSTVMFIVIILIVLVIFFVIVIAVVFIVIKNKRKDSTPVPERKVADENIRNFEQREPQVNQRRVQRTPSEESISSLIGRSKSKTSVTHEIDDNDEEENEKNSDNDSEEKRDDKKEAKSEDKKEEKSEDKKEEESEVKNADESETKVDDKSADKTENKTDDKDKSVSKDGDEDKNDLSSKSKEQEWK